MVVYPCPACHASFLVLKRDHSFGGKSQGMRLFPDAIYGEGLARVESAVREMNEAAHNENLTRIGSDCQRRQGNREEFDCGLSNISVHTLLNVTLQWVSKRSE